MQIITRLHSLSRFGRFHRSFSHCKIVEVGPRDGLQNETKIVPTEIKVSLIHKLVDAGCTTIEVGAFVSPKWVPQMADSQQVLQKIHKYEGVSYSCLVPNIQGMMLATSEKTKCTEVAIFASASETFSKKNINCTIEESLERFKPIMEMSKEKSIPVRGYVSCVLGCPYEGLVPLSSVIRVAEHLYDMGCYEISLGDTIGVGTPNQVRKLIEAVQSSIPSEKIAVHFHDTFGQALANILVALESNIRIVDTSVAGLGGCPYAKGASGNVATEDVIYMLHGMGVETGLDIEKIVSTGHFICHALGKTPISKVSQALFSKLTMPQGS